MQKHLARLVAQKFMSQANAPEKKMVELKFQVEGGPCDGQTFKYGPKSLSVAMKPILRKVYLAMGWDGTTHPARVDVARYRQHVVEISLEEESWTDAKGKRRSAMAVAFVNPLIASQNPALAGSDLDAVGDFFKAGGEAAADDDDDDREYDDEEAFRSQAGAT